MLLEERPTLQSLPKPTYFRSIQGDGKAALKGVCRASLRLSRPGALRFSSGLFLHLATDACFTILEQVRIDRCFARKLSVGTNERNIIRNVGGHRTVRTSCIVR